MASEMSEKNVRDLAKTVASILTKRTGLVYEATVEKIKKEGK